MLRRRPPAVPCLAIVGLLVSVSSPALAFEREWHLGARAGAATLQGAPLGPAIDVHGAYGLNDMFDAVVALTGSRHGLSEGPTVLSATAGVSYKIDVIQWVPYVGALAGYYHFGAPAGVAESRGGRFGAAASAGIDYLLTRSFALGAELRWHATFDDGLSFSYFTGVAGVEYRWGF